MWIKLFRKRKSQTIMIFFVVLLCTMLLNGAMTILTSLNEPYEQLKEECQPADLVVFEYSGEKEKAAEYGQKFAALDEVDKVVQPPYVYVEDEIYVGDQKIDAFIDLVEYDKEAYRKVRYVEGSTDIEKDLTQENCFIPACIQKEYDLQIGDVISIKNTKGDINYEIAGVIAEPFSTSTAFDSAVLVKEIPKALEKVQYKLMVYAKDGYTGEDIKRAYQKENTGIFSGFITTVDASIANGLTAINIVAALFLAIGIIMLVVSGLIINFMVRDVLFTDVKSIAVYKTIGYTTGNILKMYLLFYFVIVAAASMLGVCGSKIFANYVLGSLFENLGQTKNINVLHTGVACMITVICFVLLIVYSVIIKAKNVKPVYALNGFSNNNTKKKKYRGGSEIAFSPFSIALRNIRRDKKGVLGIISLDVACSQKENNDYWIGVDASDVIVNVSDSTSYEAVEKIIQSDSRVDYYLNISQGDRVLFDWKDIDASPSISAFLYDDYETVDLPVVEGRNPKNAKEIAIASVVAQ